MERIFCFVLKILLIWEKEDKLGGGRERGRGEADFQLSREPHIGLDLGPSQMLGLVAKSHQGAPKMERFKA